MQHVDRDAEWLVALGTGEDTVDDFGVDIDHWLLEDFADIVPPSPDRERRAA